MTLHEYRDLEQRSDEWLTLRCGIVTASVVGQLVTTKARGAADFDCPACPARALEPCLSKRTGQPISTLHPERAAVAKDDDSPPTLVLADNDTTRGLAAFLAAERVAGVDPDGTYLNRDMFRGIIVEAPAREKYAEHYGVEVSECGFLLLEDDGLRLGFSPDGLVGDDGGIEIKSPRQRSHLLTAVLGVVPAQHLAQIQCALLVSGRDWWDYVSYSPGLQMWVTRVLPDPDWFQAIRAAVREIESVIDELVSEYTAAVEGFPVTERLDLEVVA